MTMGSRPLGADERVVIVGGGIGERGWRLRTGYFWVRVQRYGSRPSNLLNHVHNAAEFHICVHLFPQVLVSYSTRT